ncbi:MAG: radical SAM/SPASM domain-containing protein [Deltaproteobacteria bacterium]
MAILSEQTKNEVGLPTYCCIALLESCFLKCRMCYKWQSDIGSRDPDEPTLKQWKEFIVSLRKMVNGRFQINFAGGEALAREETLGLIRHASECGFDTLLATNAFLIDEQMAKRIGESGLGVVNISLDSLKEERHDHIRGTKGVYRNVMRALDLLDKYAAKTKVGICTVIMKENLDELSEIVRWIQANDKIDGMGFQAVTQPFSTPEDAFWYRNGRYSDLWPDDTASVDKAMDELIELKKMGLNKLGNPLSQFYVYKAYFRNPNNFIKKQKCHIDTQAINVTPTGDIRICFYMDSVGDIKYDNIDEAWFSEKAKEVRKKISACKKNCQSMVNCNFDASEVYEY